MSRPEPGSDGLSGPKRSRAGELGYSPAIHDIAALTAPGNARVGFGARKIQEAEPGPDAPRELAAS